MGVLNANLGFSSDELFFKGLGDYVKSGEKLGDGCFGKIENHPIKSISPAVTKSVTNLGNIGTQWHF